MRIDALSIAAGMQDVAADDVARGLLAQEAERFFAAGGVLTLEDWSRLGPESKAAFIVARHGSAGNPQGSHGVPQEVPVEDVLERAADELSREAVVA